MVKEIIVADKGCEDIFEALNAKIENIEAEKEAEKQEYLAKLDAEYEVRLTKFKTALEQVSVVEQIEVPDEETTEENSAEETVQ